VAELMSALVRRFPSRSIGAACAWAVALLVFVPLGAIEVVRYHKDYRGTPDWKHAALYLCRNVGGEDLMVSMKAFDGAFCLEYYARAELHDQIVDVKDLPEWQHRWRNLRGADTLPRNVWFLSPKMAELDRDLFAVVAFPNLKIVRGENVAGTWNGLWRLVTEQVLAASKATGYERGRVLSELGEMLAAVGKGASAYEVVRDLASRYPHMPNYQRQFGEVAVKLGKLDVAEQAFRATLELDPESYAFSQLADVLLRLGKRDEAVEVVRKAVAAKDEPYRRTWLGLVYAVAGKHDRAEEELRRAIAMAPDYAYAHYRFGQFCAARNRLDDAVSEYRTALRLDPASPAFGLLADILVGTRRYDEAETVIRDAIAVKDEPYRRVRLGMVYAGSGKFDLAEQQYLKAIAMEVDYEYAHYRLAQLYVMLGRKGEAVAEYETVLRLKPDADRVKAVQAELDKLRKGGPSGE
jgi:tetratricopeptide (TPR) repeat protein